MHGRCRSGRCGSLRLTADRDSSQPVFPRGLFLVIDQELAAGGDTAAKPLIVPADESADRFLPGERARENPGHEQAGAPGADSPGHAAYRDQPPANGTARSQHARGLPARVARLLLDGAPGLALSPVLGPRRQLRYLRVGPYRAQFHVRPPIRPADGRIGAAPASAARSSPVPPTTSADRTAKCSRAGRQGAGDIGERVARAGREVPGQLGSQRGQGSCGLGRQQDQFDGPVRVAAAGLAGLLDD